MWIPTTRAQHSRAGLRHGGDLTDAVAEERLATRLGGADRQVAFEPAPLGPFRSPVASLRVPAHPIPQGTGDVPALLEASAPGDVTFTLGAARFRYGRMGLESTA